MMTHPFCETPVSFHYFGYFWRLESPPRAARDQRLPNLFNSPVTSPFLFFTIVNVPNYTPVSSPPLFPFTSTYTFFLLPRTCPPCFPHRLPVVPLRAWSLPVLDLRFLHPHQAIGLSILSLTLNPLTANKSRLGGFH